jgi:hypothetical protein
VPPTTKVILSHHDYKETPSDALLEAEVQEMFDAGADIAKIATTALRIEDSARMLALPGKSSGVQPNPSHKSHCCCALQELLLGQAPAMIACRASQFKSSSSFLHAWRCTAQESHWSCVAGTNETLILNGLTDACIHFE